MGSGGLSMEPRGTVTLLLYEENDKRPGIRDRMSGFLGRFLGVYLHFFRFTAEMAEVCTLVRGLQKESV